MSCENNTSVRALPRLGTAAEIEAILGKPPSVIMLKQVGTLDDGCRASPAVAGNALFVRTLTHLYRIESRE